MKKIFIFLSFFLFISFNLFSQVKDNKVYIDIINNIDENKNIEKETYEYELTYTKENTDHVINTLIKAYYSLQDKYANTIYSFNDYINVVNEKVSSLQEKINEYENVNNKKEEVNQSLININNKEKIFRLGVFTNYSYIYDTSNNIDLKIAINIKDIFINTGGVIGINKIGDPKFGFTVGVGYWFF